MQHIIPFLIALKRKGDLPELPKDMRNLLAKNYLVQAVVDEKLKKAKESVPDYDEDKLRTVIEEGVIRAIKRKPVVQ